ncbi:tRNA-splicing endonuclease subunit sen15 [Anaeramoeba flamelloides]|uniref:tRNA-splicing endonuclease subunit sen15 n=1 Tax=Anaeramoeba flamelloides TaxID=1746091 RepID=A0AAV7YBJ5_9EUKA|nr:tRNA-splicing endonuclease subunit sen15 [Anaeramoeba flamelloides]
MSLPFFVRSIVLPNTKLRKSLEKLAAKGYSNLNGVLRVWIYLKYTKSWESLRFQEIHETNNLIVTGSPIVGSVEDYSFYPITITDSWSFKNLCSLTKTLNKIADPILFAIIDTDSTISFYDLSTTNFVELEQLIENNVNTKQNEKKISKNEQNNKNQEKK